MIQSQWQSQSIPQLKQTLTNIYDTMIKYEKDTDFQNAQSYRKYHQQCTQYIYKRNLKQIQQLHTKQINDTNIDKINEIKKCNKKWQDRLKQYDQQCKKLYKQLQLKHQQQHIATHIQMQNQLSLIVKQSKQLLNLRRMQQYASKQKSFVQAHSIQQRISQVYQRQKIKWMEDRQKTIDKALKNLKNVQDKQREGIDRRIRLTLQDFAKDKLLQQISIDQRFNKIMKQMLAKQQREILSINKQLRNLGGESPKKRTKQDTEN